MAWDPRDIYRTEFVQRHVEEAQRTVAAHFRGMVDALTPRQPFDSPLEAAFYVWSLALDVLGPEEEIALEHQVEVTVGAELFRLDFAYVLEKVAIELDGHDFHERTREQVDRRNYRDRRLLEEGWLVLHFSGSEFNRDPAGCVRAAQRAALLRKVGQ